MDSALAASDEKSQMYSLLMVVVIHFVTDLWTHVQYICTFCWLPSLSLTDSHHLIRVFLLCLQCLVSLVVGYLISNKLFIACLSLLCWYQRCAMILHCSQSGGDFLCTVSQDSVFACYSTMMECSAFWMPTLFASVTNPFVLFPHFFSL